MFWKFLAVLLAASALIYLGSLSVWVTVLSISVKVLLATIAALLVGVAAAFFRQQYRKSKQSDPNRLIFKQ
ncbi:MAG: hypothetical protein POELPBGB_04032 [Bacteroidia bacterium]|nr:hypothetical protein [Bacteroidia bacterium]